MLQWYTLVRNCKWGGAKLPKQCDQLSRLQKAPIRPANLRVILWYPNIDVEQAAFIGRSCRSRQLRPPEEDIGFIGRKCDRP